MWPLSLFRPLSRTGPGVGRLVLLLRLLGVAGILLLVVAALFVGVAVSALVGPDDGWAGLVAAVALVVAALALAGGLGLSVPPHFVLRHLAASDDRAWPWVRGTSIAWGLVGATFWAPVAWKSYVAPLDWMLFVGRLALLVAAGLLWVLGRRALRPPQGTA